jgi:hypothetical protein
MEALIKILLLLSISCTALAQDCSDVNLLTMPNSPFEKIPVYDQQESNICYAYAAAQMVDFHNIRRGAEKRNVHPAWPALIYAQNRKREGLDIGHTKDAIEGLREARNCDFEKVSGALTAWASAELLPDSRILAFIEKYSTGERAPTAVDATTGRMLADLRARALNPVQMVARLLDPACRERTPLEISTVRKYNYSDLPDDWAFESFLRKRLAQTPTPISIAYCSKVWKDPDYDGIDLTYFGKRDALKKDCDYHESLVVGRKVRGDACHLLVRNTWGDRWNAGNRRWQCLCRERATGRFIDDCAEASHPDARYAVEACWIPARTLARNVGVVTVMD